MDELDKMRKGWFRTFLELPEGIPDVGTASAEAHSNEITAIPPLGKIDAGHARITRQRI